MLEARGFDVIRFDNRDCGRSTRIPVPLGRFAGLLRPRKVAPYDVDDMACDAAGLLEALGVGHAHVMGISLGGMIAQSLAINHPERVASLTCVSSTPVWHDLRPFRAPKLRVAARMFRLPPRRKQPYIEFALPLWRMLNGSHFAFEEEHVRELLDASWDWSGGADPEADRRQVLAVRAAPDRTPGLRTLGKPAVVIHGTADPLVRPRNGIDTAKALGTEPVEVKGMGHYTPRQTWSIVVDGVARAAAEAERRAALGAPAP